jgi:predicted GH43/DUF377 family glycosyl hydrolase
MQLKKYENNPIIKPIKNHRWESKATFNGGIVYDQGKFHLLYRAIGEYKNYISRIGYAVSEDGINFERKAVPVLRPLRLYERWGMEDPRITKIGDRFYITYVALNKSAIRDGGGIIKTALYSTKDFINFKRHGVITPPLINDRDVVIFPEKMSGRYVMLHRPYYWIKDRVHKKDGELFLDIKAKVIKWPIEEKPGYFPDKPSIWIAYSDDLKNWFNHKVLIEPQEDWESKQLGSGTPPIKTEKGWLLIYHGVSDHRRKSVFGYASGTYRVGAFLLDLDDPAKVIARTREPILEPRGKYEISGDTPQVVFPVGAAIVKKKLYVYYGAADKTVCLATAKLDRFLDYLSVQKPITSKQTRINISFPIYLYKNNPGIYDHPTNINSFARDETFTRLINSIIKNLPFGFDANIYIIFGKTNEGISDRKIEKLLRQAINKKVRNNDRVHIYIMGARALSEIKKLRRNDLIIDNRGYGNIRNLQLITQILFDIPYQLNLDDDEIIPNCNFFNKVLEIEKMIKKEKNLVGVGGLYLNNQLSPDISRQKKITKGMNVFEKRLVIQQQLIEFYKKKKWHFPAGVVFGGLNVMSNKVVREVCFDPFITRGEDIDFLINAFLKNFLFSFYSNWSIIHKPPQKSLYPFLNLKNKMRRDIIRFSYQKRKIEYLAKKFRFKKSSLLQILDPYPGFFLKLPEHKLKSDAFKYMDPLSLEKYINETLDKEINRFLRMYKIWPSFCKTLDNHKDITAFFIRL